MSDLQTYIHLENIARWNKNHPDNQVIMNSAPIPEEIWEKEVDRLSLIQAPIPRRRIK